MGVQECLEGLHREGVDYLSRQFVLLQLDLVPEKERHVGRRPVKVDILIGQIERNYLIGQDCVSLNVYMI